MSYFDLVIIYLACGAPFGVYELTITRAAGNVALHGLAAVLFWPIYASRHLKRFFGADAHLQNDVLRIQAGFERAVFSNASSGELFEFREVYQRLTGLAAAANKPSSTVHELFTATEHPDPRLGSVCLARRNRTRIDFHLMRARQDLIGIIYAVQPEQNEAIADLLNDLGSVIGSPDLVHEGPAPTVLFEPKNKRTAAASTADLI